MYTYVNDESLLNLADTESMPSMFFCNFPPQKKTNVIKRYSVSHFASILEHNFVRSNCFRYRSTLLFVFVFLGWVGEARKALQLGLSSRDHTVLSHCKCHGLRNAPKSTWSTNIVSCAHSRPTFSSCSFRGKGIAFLLKKKLQNLGN